MGEFDGRGVAVTGGAGDIDAALAGVDPLDVATLLVDGGCSLFQFDHG